MAISPTKPDFFDGTWRGKVRVWAAPTCAQTDTAIVGLKRIFGVTVGNRPVVTYTTSAGATGTTVITFTITASCTGSALTPLTVYGQ